jgi:hypothetical protein
MKIRRFLLLAFLLAAHPLSAAPPTEADDKAVAGSWQVNPPGTSRIYEISEGRTLKIVGGDKGDKRGRLMPQEDGSYLVDADGAILRLVHLKPDDQLIVEFYRSKDDIKRGLPFGWKATGERYKKP